MAQTCFQEIKKSKMVTGIAIQHRVIQHRDQAPETVLANVISGEALVSIHEREAVSATGDVTATRGAGEVVVSETHLRMSGALSLSVSLSMSLSVSLSLFVCM